jgi:hypothetical protein
VSRETGYERLWSAVQALETQAWEEWRKEYHPSQSPETTLSGWIRSIETTVCRKRGGYTLVTVSIVAIRARESQVNVFQLQRAGNKFYVKGLGT